MGQIIEPEQLTGLLGLKALEPPRQAPPEAWERLSAFFTELGGQPFAAASERRGRPEQVSLPRVLELCATRSSWFAQELRRARGACERAPERSGREFMKAWRREAPAQRKAHLLLAAVLRGEREGLLRMAGTASRPAPGRLPELGLARALLHFYLGLASAQEWVASEAFARRTSGDLGEVVVRLGEGGWSPTLVGDWRRYYRERERAFAEVGIPALPELGPCGIPLEWFEPQASPKAPR